MILTGSYAVCFVVIVSVLFFMILIGSYNVSCGDCFSLVFHDLNWLVQCVLWWLFQSGSLMGHGDDHDYPDGYHYKAWSHANGGWVRFSLEMKTWVILFTKEKKKDNKRWHVPVPIKKGWVRYMTFLHPAPVSAYLKWKSHKRHSCQCLLNQIKGKVNLHGCLWKWSKGCDKGTSSAHVWLLDSRTCYPD